MLHGMESGNAPSQRILAMGIRPEGVLNKIINNYPLNCIESLFDTSIKRGIF